MAIFVAMEQSGGAPEMRAERALLVRDGFAFWAFVLPVVWLLAHRLWLEAGLAFALAVAATAVGIMLEAPVIATLLHLAISLWFGLEANNLRVEALRRRGWREVMAIAARNRDEAEIRFATGRGEDVVPASPGIVPVVPAPSFSGRPPLDLFAHGDRR